MSVINSKKDTGHMNMNTPISDYAKSYKAKSAVQSKRNSMPYDVPFQTLLK